MADGHQAEFVRDHVPPGSADPVVATVSQDVGAVLISFDGDFQRLAARIPRGQRRRFRRLSRIRLRCRETEAASRLQDALAFVEQEYAIAEATRGGRMVLEISMLWLKTER